METPQRKKVVVPGLAERPTEAPASALEQLLFEGGVAMESWIGYECLVLFKDK
ncbi:hypothetical protein [Flavobacterium sp. N3904]|uniref:hypothetical protein n=1 Tax=Flavobacterium sp. N3904 TaxID=2986835 RepID=UPI0022242D71|nr:hypothetical protein [Flavobacterium sp. N3904]